MDEFEAFGQFLINLTNLQKNQNYKYSLDKPFLSLPFGYPKDTLVSINDEIFTIIDSILVKNENGLFDPFYLVKKDDKEFLVKGDILNVWI